jgi:RNA polymerase II subunit A C-terminal domain phosphatase
MSRKRLRSVTPSEAPVPINGETQDDSLRSPLAKRKKMAAERTGLSKLKEAISAEDLDKGPEAASNRREDESSSHDVTAGTEGDDENDGDEDAGDDEDDEDDFLARELEEEEWG